MAKVIPLESRDSRQEAFGPMAQVDAGDPVPQDLPGPQLEPRCHLLQGQDFMSRISRFQRNHLRHVCCRPPSKTAFSGLLYKNGRASKPISSGPGC